MPYKPFRPPAFLQQRPFSDDACDDPEPAAKRQRTAAAFKTPDVTFRQPSHNHAAETAFRTPLLSVENSSQPTPSEQCTPKQVYSALWRKVTTKKHKTWDGDGTVILKDGYACLKNEKGKYMGRRPCAAPLQPGDMLSISGMDVEIDSLISSERADSLEDEANTASKLQLDAKTMPFTTPTISYPRPSKPTELPTSSLTPMLTHPNAIRVRQLGATTMKPFINSAMPSIKLESADPRTPVPKHDPAAEGALVMSRPKSVPKGKQVVDVVVDPFICRKLREHQREGVAFMYECVMGLRCKEGCGAILADEMGLGKSLQTIALLWTLLKQNPVYGDRPVVRKAIIICPASVVKNWRKEFRKWLGSERVGVLALSEDQKRISSFTRGKAYQVLVLSYEMFNNVRKDLQKCDSIDIVIADEGHRLKTAKNKTIAAVNTLDIERRLVLTGTLLQNDYSEWYSVVDFVNPGFLGKYSIFKRDFETPILRGRQQYATQEDLDRAEEADRELKAQTGSFILRRTAEILSKYLPGKTEYVLFCRPTDFQARLYQTILGCGALSDALGHARLRFPWINILKKACNSPALLAAASDKDKDKEVDPDSPTLLSRITEVIPISELAQCHSSGKLRVLDSLLHTIRTTTDEKVVVMSNYTTTLDLIGNMLSKLDYNFLRLDGSTPTKTRQDLVDRFNSTPATRTFAFLMSTKAGGVGINLIGASRLVLFDADWNPALDAQAMARICRDGQRRPCSIYRLVAKGAIEERIFQRQMVKMGLADAVVDGKAGGADSFSPEEVRDLFSFDSRPGCRTHEVLGCSCAMDGAPPATDGMPDGTNKDQRDLQDSDDEDLPSLKNGSFISASDLERKGRSASPRKKESGPPRGLMLYSHLDARGLRQARQSGEPLRTERETATVSDGGSRAAAGAEDEHADLDVGEDDEDGEAPGEEEDGDGAVSAVRDAVLRTVLLEDDSAVDFVFAKSSEKLDPDRAADVAAAR